MLTNIQLDSHRKTISRFLDDSVLAPNSTLDEAKTAAQRVVDLKLNSLVTLPRHLEGLMNENQVKDINRGLLRLSAVIGFPDQKFTDLEEAKKSLGSAQLEDKISEAKKALAYDGVVELDPVINVQNLIEKNVDALMTELEAYFKLVTDNKKFTRENPLVLKPIFSTEILEASDPGPRNDLVSFAVDTLAKAFAKFKQSNPEAAEKIMIVFKNSTGFCPDIANGVNGFNIEHMVKIKNLIEERENLDNLLPEGTIGIKAAGGIKTGQQSRDIQRALGNRLSMIGTSSVDNILNS